MVMRNPHNGTGSSGGRDDLPPHIRDRFRSLDDIPELKHLPPPSPEIVTTPAAPDSPTPPGPVRHNWVGDLGRLALLLLAVAVADLLFILVCLSFLAGNPLAVGAR